MDTDEILEEYKLLIEEFLPLLRRISLKEIFEQPLCDCMVILVGHYLKKLQNDKDFKKEDFDINKFENKVIFELDKNIVFLHIVFGRNWCENHNGLTERIIDYINCYPFYGLDSLFP